MRAEFPTRAQTVQGLVLAACIVILFVVIKSYSSENVLPLPTFDEEITQCMAEPDQTLQLCVEAYAERFSPI